MSICHNRELFVNYQPTLLSRFDDLTTKQPTKLIVFGRGWVHLEVRLCDGTVKKIAIKDVFHVPNAPVNIFSPDTNAHIRRGFLIHNGDAIALVQQSNMQTIMRVPNGSMSLYPELASEEQRKMRIPSKYTFIRGENEPPRLPPIPTDPTPVAFRLPLDMPPILVPVPGT